MSNAKALTSDAKKVFAHEKALATCLRGTHVELIFNLSGELIVQEKVRRGLAKDTASLTIRYRLSTPPSGWAGRTDADDVLLRRKARTCDAPLVLERTDDPKSCRGLGCHGLVWPRFSCRLRLCQLVSVGRGWQGRCRYWQQVGRFQTFLPRMVQCSHSGRRGQRRGTLPEGTTPCKGHVWKVVGFRSASTTCGMHVPILSIMAIEIAG